MLFKYIYNIKKLKIKLNAWWPPNETYIIIISYENQMTQLPFKVKNKLNLLNLIHRRHVKFLTMAT